MDQVGEAELAAFAGGRYLNLETYRRDGRPVRTPVWFAAAGPVLYVYTTADAGKAKRVRRDGAARIAPCDISGRLTGPWIDAEATIVQGDEAALGMRLLDPSTFRGNSCSELRGCCARRRAR